MSKYCIVLKRLDLQGLRLMNFIAGVIMHADHTPTSLFFPIFITKYQRTKDLGC